MSESPLELRILDEVGHINLRGDAGDAAFKKAAKEALGQELPVQPNTITIADHCVCWLGPDEWLIMTPAEAVPALLQRLQEALDGQHVAVNDLSGGQVAMRLSGTAARNLLAKGCTLDFHRNEFPVGACAQSGLAKANVVIACISDPDSFDIVVRRSFLDYLLKWFETAGRDVRIEFR